MLAKNELLIFNCLKCRKNHKKKYFNKYLTKRFRNKYEFCDGNINDFCLMLKKGVSLYEYIISWKRFDEKLIPEKEDFYNNLNIEDITDYKHAKKV